MPYAILRFEKRKGGPASALEKHHERKKERYASNPDIDRERTHLNYHLVEPRQKYYGEIQSRIEKAQRENPKCKVRKDSVKFIDTIVTATPEFLDSLPPEQVRRYFERALEFPQLDRGQASAVTKRKHIPTWLYKQSHRLTSEMVQIQKEIKNIGTLNAGKQREKILALLTKWYPKVNAFEAQLRPYDEQLKIMEQNEQVLRRNEEQAQWLRQQERQESESLLYELRECQALLTLSPRTCSKN